MAAAGVALILAIFLLLGTWDELYDTLDLPHGVPALTAQLGGAAFAGLAYLLWAAASRPELAPAAAGAGAIAYGIGALVIALWLVFRDPEADLGIETAGTVILILLGAAGSALIFARLPKEAGASLSARARPLAVEQEPAPASQS